MTPPPPIVPGDPGRPHARVDPAAGPSARCAVAFACGGPGRDGACGWCAGEWTGAMTSKHWIRVGGEEMHGDDLVFPVEDWTDQSGAVCGPASPSTGSVRLEDVYLGRRGRCANRDPAVALTQGGEWLPVEMPEDRALRLARELRERGERRSPGPGPTTTAEALAVARAWLNKCERDAEELGRSHVASLQFGRLYIPQPTELGGVLEIEFYPLMSG